MTVHRFHGHYWHRCEKPCTKIGCAYCDGGLASCDVCHGLEGALPTDCPGSKMTGTQIDAVYDGSLDYRWREGWVHASSVHSPAHYRRD